MTDLMTSSSSAKTSKPSTGEGAEPKKGSKKQTLPQVIRPLQIVRVRCACSAHDPLPPAASPRGASDKAKGERKRGRGAPRPKLPLEPWIRGLYVVWCATPTTGQKPEFMVAQSDLDGHLCIPGDSPDSFKIATHEGQEFRFWFVRHPDAGVARQIRDALADGDRETYGPGFAARLTRNAQPDPDRVVLSCVATGKDARGTAVSEPVLSIPAKPSFFVPKGSKLYGEWSIYRLVLTDTKTRKDRDCQPFEQCSVLRKQVRRLQFHLGALRYLVGDHGHPYIPTVQGSFPNEGVFDLVTWNSVLRFQSEAASGTAFALDTNLHGKILSPVTTKPPEQLDSSWGEPTELAVAMTGEAFQLTREFANARPASGVATPSFAMVGLVDETTAGALALWIASGYRKPGGIMVAWVGGSEACFWLRERACERLDALSAKVKALGFKQGWRLNHTYRDARVDALGAGFGRAKRSIHKTGFAMDLRMHDYVPLPGDEWPILLTMEHSALQEEQAVQAVEHAERAPELDDQANKTGPRAGHRVKVSWRLFGEVNAEPSAVPADAKYYVDEVTPWQYDAMSPMGGVQLPPRKGRFIDLTEVALDHGWCRIHSFGDDKLSSQDWRGGPRLLGCTSVDALSKVLEELIQIKENPKLASAVMWTCPAATPQDFASRTLAERVAAITAAGGQRVALSVFDLAELRAVADWIEHFGKQLPPDLSIDVQYHVKAAQDPAATRKLLETQLRTRFSALLKPPKHKTRRDIDGWTCECLALEASGDVKAGTLLSTVTMTADHLTVGDGDGKFPQTSFRIRPVRPTLAANLPEVPTVYFPQTVGEAIGMEWWHYQLRSGLEMNEKDRVAAKAKAQAGREATEVELTEARNAKAAAEAACKASATEANKTARDAARKRVADLEARKKHAQRIMDASSLPATWWSMIQEIGWTETGMRAMGYADEDFAADAH